MDKIKSLLDTLQWTTFQLAVYAVPSLSFTQLIPAYLKPACPSDPTLLSVS